MPRCDDLCTCVIRTVHVCPMILHMLDLLGRINDAINNATNERLHMNVKRDRFKYYKYITHNCNVNNYKNRNVLFWGLNLWRLNKEKDEGVLGRVKCVLDGNDFDEVVYFFALRHKLLFCWKMDLFSFCCCGICGSMMIARKLIWFYIPHTRPHTKEKSQHDMFPWWRTAARSVQTVCDAHAR